MTEPTLTRLTLRLDRLERENRRLKFTGRHSVRREGGYAGSPRSDRTQAALPNAHRYLATVIAYPLRQGREGRMEGPMTERHPMTAQELLAAPVRISPERALAESHCDHSGRLRVLEVMSWFRDSFRRPESRHHGRSDS